ncbi:MAG: ABC transporter ATP-binding protein [Coriobacteriales bacterium]|nr:ABC transporter ATP-binding protein [Coriobacteriales bacterium]
MTDTLKNGTPQIDLDAQSEAYPLCVKDVAYTYPHARNAVFEHISLDAPAGKMLAILGNNGAGKSTFLDLLAGITKPSEGTITVDGASISRLSRREAAQRIAYVAQQQTIPHLSVYDEVLLGRKPHITWAVTEKDREIVAQAIAGMELEAFTLRYCDELSGGERQKVFIARALAQQPKILILDEPTSALDPKNQVEVLKAIRDATHERNLTTILVLHDINLALRFCDLFLLIRDGNVVTRGGHEAITEETLATTYGTEFELVTIGGVPVAVPRII